jgi:DNA invertase Pin-like site-specific DNA recombinase
MEIGYARVSTQDQHPALQLDALHTAGCAKVFVEQASGAQRDRPQLQAALDYARSGDTLVVWKLDRLARSLTQLIETIELLAAREIGFPSLTEAIETTTAGGRLVFHIFASLAEFERAIIRERTRAGLDAAHARQTMGVFFAGLIYGHQLTATMGKYVLDLEMICQVLNPEDMANRIEYLPLR